MEEEIKKMVLVIEDDEDTNDLVCSTLELSGYSTSAAYDGAEGIQKARELLPDLIILDIMMPKFNGIDVSRMLKSDDKTKGVPIIVISAKTDLSTRISTFVNGVSRYISKPFDIDGITDEVENELEKKNETKASIMRQVLDI